MRIPDHVHVVVSLSITHRLSHRDPGSSSFAGGTMQLDYNEGGVMCLGPVGIQIGFTEVLLCNLLCLIYIFVTLGV